MPITAKELAAQLNLSESAVSLALNNKPGVSNFTRKRVIEAARKSGYDFTRKASVLSSMKGKICFVFYKKSGAVLDDTPFFSALSEGVSLSCRKEHFTLEIRYLYEDDSLNDQIYELKTQSYDAILVLATEMQESDLRWFADFTVPLVFLDAYFDVPLYHYVYINNNQGAFMATNYLIRHCKSQPGYLRSNYPISNFDQRADGFYRAIRAAGMSASKSLVHRLTPSQEGAYEDMKQLLAEGEELASCYFADNDLIAIGAMEAFLEAGYRIPEDVSVIGFDDIPACEYTYPALTTVSVPKQFIGQTAVSIIIGLLEHIPINPIAAQVFTKLIKRKSVI